MPPQKDFVIWRYTVYLAFGFLVVAALHYGQSILMPITFAALLAMLMLPLVEKLESKGVNPIIATLITVLIIVLFVTGVIFFFFTQIMSLIRDLPELKSHLMERLANLQQFIEGLTGFSVEEQIIYLQSRSGVFVKGAESVAGNVIFSTLNTAATFFLIIIYVFFFIYYRQRFSTFIIKITPNHNPDQTMFILGQISRVTRQYLYGLLIVITILAVLNSIGLVTIGIEHAILLAIMAAALDIIPYIGPFIGMLLPLSMALLTEDSFVPAIAIIGLWMVIQLLENYILTPYIVGGKVKLNPLAAIIALIIGGYIWGIVGMILFIPLLGILKIIFDNLENLKPYGYLIGLSESHHPTLAEKLKTLFNNDKSDH